MTTDCEENTDRLSKALVAAQNMATRAMRLQEVTAALSQARTETGVADVVLGRGLGVVEGQRGILARVDGDRLKVIRATGYSSNDGEHVTRSLVEPSPLSQAVRTGEPVWLTSAQELRAQFPDVFRHDHALRPAQAIVAVPLRHCDELVGAIEMSFAEPTALGAADQAFTLLLAQATADALFRAQSYDAELQARRDAESRARERADVLGIVAHDLRNPLNVISTSGELLSEGEFLTPDQHQQMIDVMQRAVRQMNRLIGDLLDASQLQAGHLTLELSDVDARQLVRATTEMCRHEAATRDIELSTVVPEDETIIRADEGRVMQALGNLLGNALKFTDPGGQVVLSVVEQGGEIVFSVSDTGHGIAPEQCVHLFDRFWQARDGDKRGVGLGLTIAKGIVDAHGGKIWVESTPGVGSTFFVALPMKPEPAPAHSGAEQRRTR
jgi:signal transduction histidine kinase